MSDSQGLEKIFAGARLRRLRRERGLTQAEAAEALGLSSSYLNLLERNQRPVTARVLLALADAFDVDVRAFANESDRQLIADLQEAAADPVLSGLELDRMELSEFADAQPRAAEAFARLYHAFRETSAATADLATRMSGPGAATGGPGAILESVRDALDARQNHFPELEEAAETLIGRTGLRPRNRERTLSDYLQDQYGFTVRILDEEVMAGARRRLDFHGRRLLLSELLSPGSRAFHIAVVLATLELGDTLDRLCDDADMPTPEGRKLYRAGLANYFAGALHMPYAAFHKHAETTRYDIDRLQRRFEVSFEQICHRLTTLQRPGARGLPFFMIRVDAAGNVSKRFGGGIMPFARSGGGCPKWSLYDALRTPERLIAQAIELPDGTTMLSLARGQIAPGPAGHPPVVHAIALGCAWEHAARVAHADPIASTVPAEVGIACRLCDREDCAQRAFPPMNRKLVLDTHMLRASPYSFNED
ncbi:short-chain fatty acyl-CoA regulator family protein [Maricaulis sp.]|uniref:helix-turn-helix domain-containing protein n=1 Tax=Maricaulis sp. TaxID=1486257 RepID=UPI00260C9DBC|nr:short-chain fatty acyl-CoA regulator family protein [Maricaulis sp.]